MLVLPTTAAAVAAVVVVVAAATTNTTATAIVTTVVANTVVTFANIVGRMLCIHPCLCVCLLAGLLKNYGRI